MVTRRSVFGLFAAACSFLGSNTAQAGSIIELFGLPEPYDVHAKRAVTQRPPVKKVSKKLKAKRLVNSATSKKKTKSTQPFKIDPRFEPQQVHYVSPYASGTIVVNSNERFLYLITGPDTARRYGVAIGKEGLGWKGTATIKAKAEWPSWTPTPAMIKRSPNQYARYKNGMPGGGANPLGARALYFYQGKRDIAIRIHGTTQPWTIGKAASNGCFRMVNEHVIDLYGRVPKGTKVVVL